MRYPEGFLWDYPGFPAIAISYLRTNDFFYSGHVGMPIIMGLEFKKEGKMGLFWFSIFTCFFEAFTMIVTRGHYIIDLISGIIFAHYFYILVNEYIGVLDNSCISMCLEHDREQSTLDETTPLYNYKDKQNI
jgi:hypothetical protein